jgi:hypothetical protein
LVGQWRKVLPFEAAQTEKKHGQEKQVIHIVLFNTNGSDREKHDQGEPLSSA